MSALDPIPAKTVIITASNTPIKAYCRLPVFTVLFAVLFPDLFPDLLFTETDPAVEPFLYVFLLDAPDALPATALPAALP